MNEVRKVNSIEELKTGTPIKGFIQLNYGIKSSKDILFKNNKFMVFNHIDDTTQELTEEELSTKSNIGEAIQKGTFFKMLKNESN